MDHGSAGDIVFLHLSFHLPRIPVVGGDAVVDGLFAPVLPSADVVQTHLKFSRAEPAARVKKNVGKLPIRQARWSNNEIERITLMVMSSSLMPRSSGAAASAFLSLFSLLKKSISPVSKRWGMWSTASASPYSYPSGRNAGGALSAPFSLRFPRQEDSMTERR